MHLRCHLTDVTDKVRADRQLRLRTLELTRVNEQLRSINRELEELKNRYTDLYENAPAMYFSLDPQGGVAECNQTMLSTLNYKRTQLIGRPYEDLLHESVAGDVSTPIRRVSSDRLDRGRSGAGSSPMARSSMSGSSAGWSRAERTRSATPDSWPRT